VWHLSTRPRIVMVMGNDMQCAEYLPTHPTLLTMVYHRSPTRREVMQIDLFCDCEIVQKTRFKLMISMETSADDMRLFFCTLCLSTWQVSYTFVLKFQKNLHGPSLTDIEVAQKLDSFLPRSEIHGRSQLQPWGHFRSDLFVSFATMIED